MNNDTPNKPGSEDPGPGQEKWISREEVKKLFPGIPDRQLKYWRDYKKIRSKTVRNQTFYIESDIREMVKHQSRPLKYIRARVKWVQKKLGTLDPVLLIALLTVVFLFVVNKSYVKNAVYDYWDFATPFLFLLAFCAIYGLIKGIQYLQAWMFPKKDEK